MLPSRKTTLIADLVTRSMLAPALFAPMDGGETPEDGVWGDARPPGAEEPGTAHPTSPPGDDCGYVGAGATGAHSGGDGADATVAGKAASDPEGDPLEYFFDPEAGSVAGSGARVTWTAPDDGGVYTIRARVSDGMSLSPYESVDVEVVENAPPVLADVTLESSVAFAGSRVEVGVTAHDPDGDALTYAYEADGGRFLGSGSTVDYVTPGTPGRYTITASVSDGLNMPVSRDVKVTVVEANWPPEPGNARVIPSFVPNDGDSTFLITVDVSDPDGPADVASVEADLSSLGLDAGEPLADDGRDGDARAGDGTWSLEVRALSGTTPGDYGISLLATDLRDNSAEAEVTVTVTEAGSSTGGGGDGGNGGTIPGFGGAGAAAALPVAAAAVAVSRWCSGPPRAHDGRRRRR